MTPATPYFQQKSNLVRIFEEEKKSDFTCVKMVSKYAASLNLTNYIKSLLPPLVINDNAFCSRVPGFTQISETLSKYMDTMMAYFFRRRIFFSLSFV